MTWSAWPELLQPLKSLQTRYCDFKYQAHRPEALASAQCKATSARIHRNCSTAVQPRSAHYGASNWRGFISIPGGQSKAPISWQARSSMQFILPKKLLGPVYHCACSIWAAGSHGHSEPRIILWIFLLCEKNYSV